VVNPDQIHIGDANSLESWLKAAGLAGAKEKKKWPLIRTLLLTCCPCFLIGVAIDNIATDTKRIEAIEIKTDATYDLIKKNSPQPMSISEDAPNSVYKKKEPPKTSQIKLGH